LERKKRTTAWSKSVLLAYFILALHVLLIAGVAILVLFFRGVVNYMLWIFLGGVVLIGISAFYFIRRMRAEGRSLGEMLKNPNVQRAIRGGEPAGRNGHRQTGPARPAAGNRTRCGCGHPPSRRPGGTSRNRDVSELAELARMLEKDLITVDEFNKAKRHLLNG
jgi:hypothetical protein